MSRLMPLLVGGGQGNAPTPADQPTAARAGRAKELGVTGYSGKRKADLIRMLRNH